MSLLVKSTYYVSGKKKQSLFSKMQSNIMRKLGNLKRKRENESSEDSCVDESSQIDPFDPIPREVSFNESVTVIGAKEDVSFKKLKVDDALPTTKTKIWNFLSFLKFNYKKYSCDKTNDDTTFYYYTETDQSEYLEYKNEGKII